MNRWRLEWKSAKSPSSFWYSRKSDSSRAFLSSGTLVALIQAFRAAALPVFYVLHSDEDEGFQTTSPHYKLMDFLHPREDEPVLHKVTRNCFTSTPLQRLLTQRGVRRLAEGITPERAQGGEQGAPDVEDPGTQPSRSRVFGRLPEGHTCILSVHAAST